MYFFCRVFQQTSQSDAVDPVAAPRKQEPLKVIQYENLPDITTAPGATDFPGRAAFLQLQASIKRRVSGRRYDAYELELSSIPVHDHDCHMLMQHEKKATTPAFRPCGNSA